MKSLLNFTPVFVPDGPGLGSLDFGAYPNFDTHKLYAVINVTRNVPIYIPGAPNLGASDTQVAKIFLAADTSTHSNTDVINIYYESSNTVLESNAAQETGGNLDRIAKLQEQILVELRVMTTLLNEGLNTNEDDLNELRAVEFEDAVDSTYNS
jgi:hypothetical protein